MSEQAMNKDQAAQTAGSILCVEDEQDLREILAEELEDAGYVVVQAGDGEEALAYLEKGRPDLILCDIAMPGIDGYALLSRIRETMPELADVPFVFLSAQDGSGQIISGKHAGADDYLVKPVNFDLMLATIAARIRQMRRVHDGASEKNSIGHMFQAPSGMPACKFYQNMTRTFNMMGVGIVLLDCKAAALFANTAALRLEADGVSPGLSRILQPANPAQVLEAFPAIRDVIEASLRGEEHTDFLSLPRIDGHRDLLISVCALADDAAMPDDPVVALFIAGGSRDETASIKCLETLFNLTPTEARIAWAFSQGLKPGEIAAAFDISLTTVAFHKRNIFQKTQTNRQADLIALLLTLPISAELPEA